MGHFVATNTVRIWGALKWLWWLESMSPSGDCDGFHGNRDCELASQKRRILETGVERMEAHARMSFLVVQSTQVRQIST